MSAPGQENVVGLSILVLLSLLLVLPNALADPVLNILIGGASRQFGRDELLLRPDVASIEVANDVSYRKTMSYRAVPLSALLARINPPADSVIESVALDGFAAQLPFDLLVNILTQTRRSPGLL